MKLYYSKGACSLAVRIIINEIGLKSDYEAVNLKTKQTESGADFLLVNPKGSVPTFVTDENEILTENAVIQQYLADKNKSALLPSLGEFNRYRVLEWLNFVSTELHKGCGPLFNSNVPQNIKDEIFIPNLKNKLNVAEKQLLKTKYLMGDQFTLPDGYLFVILNWLNSLKIDIHTWPNLTRYFTELKSRKSIEQSLKEENIA